MADRDPLLSEAGKLGALVLHLGTTLDERRARTAPARTAALAAAARRRAEKATPAARIDARITEIEAALPNMDPAERDRQAEWVATARQALSRLTELREDNRQRKYADEMAS